MADTSGCCNGPRGKHLDGCDGATPAPKKQSRKGRRTEVLDNVSKEAAEAWAKKMGFVAQGGGKKRHYEIEPDKSNPGKVKLIFVEDE